MNKKQNRRYILFLLPGILGLILFFMVPLGIVIWISFFDDNGMTLHHYKQALESKAFQLALRNTLILILFGIPMILAAGMGAALAFQRLFQWNVSGTRFLFLMHLLPMVLPPAVVALLMEILFPYRRGVAVACLMIGLYIWRNIPYMLLSGFLGLRNLPEDIRSAAKLDGAGETQLLRYIILPFLRPYLLVGVVLALLGVFRVFRESFLLFGSYPDQSVYYIQNYMNNLFRSNQYRQLAAVSDLFLIGLSVLLLAIICIVGKGAEK